MAKTTVALTPAGDAACAQLDDFNLPEIADRVRLAFAYAVSRGFGLERPDGFGVPGGKDNYTASTSTLDNDRKIKDLVVAVYGERDEPYFDVETLANKGLIAIAEALKAGEISSISDLLPGLDPIA